MSNYIPTTQEVRNRYVFGTYWENEGDTSGGDNAPFNRWLEQNNQQVKQSIIDLIETEFQGNEIIATGKEELIALIKGEGENK